MSPKPIPMMVAADIAVFRRVDDEAQVLLIRRGHPPYKGAWALPGGIVEPDEDLPDAAGRELMEETAVSAPFLVEVGAFGRPDRDPRGRTISIAYYTAVVSAGACAGDDAADAAWHGIGNLPRLAFDHSEVLERALASLRADLVRTHIGFAFHDLPARLSEVARTLDLFGALPDDLTLRQLIARLGSRALLRRDASGRVRPVVAFTAPLGRPLF